MVDALTGGPVEIYGVLLYRLDWEDAEDLADALMWQDAMVRQKLEEITNPKPKQD
ncbi:MAG TPA: hypothetical protein VL418_10785 [Devosiaceae bacterium]|nr:hypothetical protein [Devosiaceae bacterium]